MNVASNYSTTLAITMNKSTDFHSFATSDPTLTDSLERTNYLNQGRLHIMQDDHDHHASKTAAPVNCKSSKMNNGGISVTTSDLPCGDGSHQHDVQSREANIIDDDGLGQEMLHRLMALVQQGEDTDTVISSQGSRSSGTTRVLGETNESILSGTRESHTFHLLRNTYQLSGRSSAEEQDILLSRYVDHLSSHVTHDETLLDYSDSGDDDSINVYKRRLGHRQRKIVVHNPVDHQADT